MVVIEPVALLEQLLANEDLSEAQANALLKALAASEIPPAQAGALLVALRAKGEVAHEIRGLAVAMRELAIHPQLPEVGPTIDIVGTGGDGSGSLNISTGAALLTASCGLPVVKHGNRSVSSRCGSADVLEKLGLPMPLDESAAGQCLEQTGFTFLFAPHYHPAMKAIGPVRGALGIRTVFNILGPLANPATPPFHVIGAFSPSMARLMAECLAGMDIQRAFVVHGEPGWDEATPCGPFERYDVRSGDVRAALIDPADFSIPRADPETLMGADASENAARLRAVLTNAEAGPHRDALVLGAGLALEVSGRARNLAEGIAAASQALDEGAGTRLLAAIETFAQADS
jgi:anthranilate phosphoribosyltransferase